MDHRLALKMASSLASALKSRPRYAQYSLARLARIESVWEGAFDISTLGHFARFPLIPPVSSIAGALVEHAVDAVLGSHSRLSLSRQQPAQFRI